MPSIRSAPAALTAAVLAALLAAGGCGTAPIAVPPAELAAVAPMPVEGYQGFLPGRTLRFGPYATGPRELGPDHVVSRIGGPGSGRTQVGPYQSAFERSWDTSMRGLSFEQHGPDGASARVRLMARADVHREAWVERWFGIPTAGDDTTTTALDVIGTIEPAQPGWPAWHFGWSSGFDTRTALQDTAGWAEDDQGRRVAFAPLRHWRGEDRGPGEAPAHLGVSLAMDGRAVAAVEAFGDGRVWIDPGLPAEQRLALASLASAVLLHEALAQAQAR